jgi:hypothetical protein
MERAFAVGLDVKIDVPGLHLDRSFDSAALGRAAQARREPSHWASARAQGAHSRCGEGAKPPDATTITDVLISPFSMTTETQHDNRIGMLSHILSPAYLPFALSFVVMIGIGLIEAIGLGLGQLDLDADAAPDSGSGLLDWLGLGNDVPLLIWLTSLLGCFTIAGIALQQTAAAMGGAPLPAGLASAGALVAGLLLNTLAAHGLARVMPSFETTVISTDDLLRRRGTILEGAARRGSPARAKVVDQHGQAHFVMVEPHEDSDVIRAGETALLVRREGQLFFGLPDRSVFLELI